MKKLLCGLALLLLAVGPLVADDDFEMVSYQSVLQALDNQDQELTELRTRLASLESQEPISTPQAMPVGTCPQGSCNQNPCASMACCNQCVSKGGFSAGAGIYYLQPRFGNNPGVASFNPANNTSVIQNFDYHGRVAPVVYVGYTLPCGLGIRGQWFTFHDTVNGPSAVADGAVTGSVSTPVIGNQSLFTNLAGNLLTTSGVLGITATDLEAIKYINCCNSSYWISGGVRYAHIGQQYGAALAGVQVPGVAPVLAGAGLLTDGHNFNGVGPTMAAQARYAFPFARKVGIYGRSRGALLVGQQHNDIQTSLRGVGGGQFSSANQIVPMAELEIGLDWNQAYRSYGFFLQGGFVVQSWFGVGNTANTNVIANTGVTSFSSFDNGGNLGLYGLRTSAGVTF
jgi:hypothetical protein